MAASLQSSINKLQASSPVQTSSAPIVTSEDTASYIQSDKYLWYYQYQDDKYSSITEDKDITVNASQINLTQETNSQFIPFLMPRFYDGIDLMNMSLQIHFVNKDGDEDFAVPVNVSYSEEKIKFAWLVDSRVTAIAGEVKFEIRAIGVNEKGDEYIWITKPNGRINIMASLAGNGIIQPSQDWTTQFITQMNEKIAQAQDAAQDAQATAQQAAQYAQAAQQAASQAQTTVDTAKQELDASVEESIAQQLVSYYTKAEISNVLSDYYDKEEVDALLKDIDLSAVYEAIENIDGLANFKTSYDSSTHVLKFYNGEDVISEETITFDPSAEWVAAYDLKMDDKIADAVSVIQEDLDSYKETTNADLQDIHDSIDGLPETLQEDYYNKTATDGLLIKKADKTALAETNTKVSAVEQIANTNKTNITTVGEKVASLEEAMSKIDTSPRASYEATYDSVTGLYTLWEVVGEGDEQTRTSKGQFVIQGGGSAGGGSTLRIEYVTTSPITATLSDEVKIIYRFSGEDSSGDAITEGTYSWRVGNRTVATGIAVAGENTFDATQYLSLGTQRLTLIIEDAIGMQTTKSWTVQKIDVRLESTFNDQLTYPMGTVSFDYTPYGAISKTVHIKLDGEEIDTVETSASGIPMAYTLPAQTHGAHLLDAYITAEINGSTVESNHVLKDIIWYDATSTVPVIGCVQQSFTARQYDTTNIVYTVYDPSTETPTVILAVDGNTVSTLTLESNVQTWQFKTADVGSHTLTITCGETIKTLSVEITELDINIEPVTAGLVFDFNPVGKNNADTDRLWHNETVAMAVSDNFDWTNGGYQIDSNGDQYFCIKAGTSAEIDYNLFADDAKRNGKEFKLIFKTVNVADENATFLKCLDNTTDSNHIGIQMDVHEARIYAQSENLPLPYAENSIMEFEFNISKNTETPAMVMGYENGVSTRPLVYGDSHSFTQVNPQTISLGSPDCDLHIYRFKVYNTSLTARGILNNFIADARNAEEMIDRYNRNQIYDENSQLTPEVLAEKCPWLRIIKIETPRFTQDKDDKVAGATIECIFKGGDPLYDNWIATDCVTSGQGTSSNNYGPAGRNLDLIMKTYKDYGNAPEITLGDGKTKVSKISLTRNSIEVDYLNVKVNIASSENANNACIAKRYNDYNPYNRPFVREDETLIPKIKDTMEFQNCVIFVKESDPDVSTHVEFADNNWHFYAVGNVGDSKKTDDSRLTDPTDKYECILEVMDNTLSNSTMPTGKVDSTGAPIYPIPAEEWTVGNTAYDALYADTFDEAKSTDKANGLADTYGWRYIYEDGTNQENAEARQYVENKWKEFYGFIVTSSDEDFKAHLGDYCVLDSVMFYYLFTLRYTMTDNHAKNSFWHYGKTGEVDSNSNPIRKWDLAFGYDFDTCIGIDNYGRMSYRYGYEEIDFVDGTTDWVWNAPQHVFFLRLRKLFDAELCDLYTRLESLGCWSATSLINQFYDWQMQFPEELWRIDIERKYIRTFTTSYINGKAYPEFLRERANGRKMGQREQFETNQEKYMASKFGSTVASSDDIILRCSVPSGELAVQPNFNITLVPYAYMYINVKYNTSPPIKIKAVPGQSYTIEYDAELADIIEIYSASCLKYIGDLSKLYLTNGTFANAEKIKELILGSDIEGYNNTNVMTLGLGSNNLLESLNIENMSGLTHALDLSALKNLKELYAHGSNVSGVTFANGGLIEIAELPPINSMTMRNLMYLTTLDIVSFDKLTSITVENCNTIDLINILENSPNINRVRITGIDWNLENTTLLERLYDMYGIDRNGYNIDQSVLTGKVHVPVMREQQFVDYKTAWSDLTITYDTMINQFPVTFVNDDGTVLEIQYVDKGSIPTDPVTREENPINVPTKESTVENDFTYLGWDSALVPVFAATTIKATYSASVRNYTVQYISKGVVKEEKTAPYGTTVFYTGDDPVYTAEEPAYKYHLFSHWDQSGYVTGDKVINAVFDVCEYTDGYFDGKDLSEMRPVEIYTLIKMEKESQYVEQKDSISFQMGNNFTFEDIEENEIIPRKTVFTGSNYIDTGIALMDEDRDYVIAIDYQFGNVNDNGSVLVQCYKSDGSNGFKLNHGTHAQITWGTDSTSVASAGRRDMLVLRHIKGENKLHVYQSNLPAAEIAVTELNSSRATIIPSTLVFGCSKADDGAYENYATGTVYWCKIWYADLGEAACKNLAAWTHEQITLEMYGFKRYYLSDNSGKRSSMSFFASHLLSTPMPLCEGSSNEGGFLNASLNTFLNNRFYQAIPVQWRQLIKQVKIQSSAGLKSKEIVTSNCYVAIPAVGEVEGAMNYEPYNYEGSVIPYITSNELRIRKYPETDTAADYWTRSPNTEYDTYYWSISSTGTLNGYQYGMYDSGVAIILSI